MKKLFPVLALIIFISSVFYAQSSVQSGTYFYSKDSQNYTLHANEGKRIVEYEITFNKPFDKKPNVVIMPSLLDAERATQIRYNIRATGISRDGFVLLAEVWGNTQLNAIGGYWIATAEKPLPEVVKPAPEPEKPAAVEPAKPVEKKPAVPAPKTTTKKKK